MNAADYENAGGFRLELLHVYGARRQLQELEAKVLLREHRPDERLALLRVLRGIDELQEKIQHYRPPAVPR